MNDFTRGLQAGLKMAIVESNHLAKSPAFFADYEHWKVYKKAIKDYRKKLEELYEA